MKYDVIIIGAGPAGLKCAEILGKDGKLRVLVAEKNSEIGPKICAGGLTGKDLEYLDLPAELIEHRFSEIKMHINGNCGILRNDSDVAYTVDRKSLGQWQLQRLKKYSNLEIRMRALVSAIDERSVSIGEEKITYKYLVGADGSVSRVRKYLGIATKRVGLGIQYVVPGTKYRDFEIFLCSKYFAHWYSWIFPHKGYVSIGTGCDPTIMAPAKLRMNFEVWLQERGIDVSGAEFQVFPINYDYQGHAFKNVYLAGDAAGFASGLTGEGIYQALISGEEIAKLILEQGFEAKKIAELLKTKARHNRILQFYCRAGRLRTIFFWIGRSLLKIPYLRKKAFELMA